MKYISAQKHEFNSAAFKNDMIADCSEEWLFFDCEGRLKAAGEDGNQLIFELQQKNVKACVFAGSKLCSIISGTDMLNLFDEPIEGFVFAKEVLVKTGRFNEYFTEGGNLEFLCRVADDFKVCVRPGRKGEIGRDSRNLLFTTEYISTLAYLCCRYQTMDPVPAGFEKVLQNIVGALHNLNLLSAFMEQLQSFISDEKKYQKFARNTAPIYIITGDDTAYGVLHDFALQLAKAFANQGQSVITTDGSYVPYRGVEDIEGRILKALVGFQATALFKDFFKAFDAPKFQFWFDDPVFFDDVFQEIEGDDSYCLLCQDGYHADHLREHYGIKNAIHFPPGGVDEGEPDFEKRDLDIVFIGTYTSPETYLDAEMNASTDFKKDYVKYMITHPYLTYEQGVKELLDKRGILLPHDQYMQLLWSLANEYRYVRSYFRHKVIETVVSNGLQLHVYGDSWKAYEGKGQENLIIHPALNPKQMNETLHRAKISLNIMSWHKDGMTERVINSMLCGALCVTDETRCISTLLQDKDRELIGIYNLNSLASLPQKLLEILQNDELRIRMASKAYILAVEDHTWKVRSEQMMKYESS